MKQRKLEIILSSDDEYEETLQQAVRTIAEVVEMINHVINAHMLVTKHD